MKQLGEIIPRCRQIAPPKRQRRPAVTQRQWEAAVGARVAARSLPLRLARGVLQVRVATAAWASELSLLSDAIVARLRAAGIAVDALRFSVGEVPAPAAPPRPLRAGPAAAPEVPLPPELRQRIERVGDPELRDALAHAAARSLARGQSEGSGRV
ncbi:MAG: DUF721 domain-containing protein [Deltaproteobacteria bacterium]|nr:DUF721 domain-containing protein [Deltaproteobacteria bacterium]